MRKLNCEDIARCQEIVKQHTIYLAPQRVTAQDEEVKLTSRGVKCVGQKSEPEFSFTCEEEKAQLLQQLQQKMSTSTRWANLLNGLNDASSITNDPDCPYECQETLYQITAYMTKQYDQDFIPFNAISTQYICDDWEQQEEIASIDCEEFNRKARKLLGQQQVYTTNVNGLSGLKGFWDNQEYRSAVITGITIVSATVLSTMITKAIWGSR